MKKERQKLLHSSPAWRKRHKIIIMLVLNTSTTILNTRKRCRVAFLYCSTVVLQLLCMIYKAYDCFANELVTEILPSQYSTAQGMLIPLFRVMPRQCCSFRDSSRETRDVLVETDTCLVSREKKCQYLAFKDLL